MYTFTPWCPLLNTFNPVIPSIGNLFTFFLQITLVSHNCSYFWVLSNTIDSTFPASKNAKANPMSPTTIKYCHQCLNITNRNLPFNSIFIKLSKGSNNKSWEQIDWQNKDNWSNYPKSYRQFSKYNSITCLFS